MLYVRTSYVVTCVLDKVAGEENHGSMTLTVCATTFDSDAFSIRNFWEVVHSLSVEQQRKLLMFVTGSDRVPVGGVSEMNFKITKLPFPNQTKAEM